MEYRTRLQIHTDVHGRKIIPMTLNWKDTADVGDCKVFLETFRKRYWRQRLSKPARLAYPDFAKYAVDGFHNYEFTIRGTEFHHHLHIAWVVEDGCDETAFVTQALDYWKEVCSELDFQGKGYWEQSFGHWTRWTSYLFKNPFHSQMVDHWKVKNGEAYKEAYYLGLIKLELTKRKGGTKGRSSNIRLNGFLNSKASPSIKKTPNQNAGSIVNHGVIHESKILQAHTEFFHDWFGYAIDDNKATHFNQIV